MINQVTIEKEAELEHCLHDFLTYTFCFLLGIFANRPYIFRCCSTGYFFSLASKIISVPFRSLSKCFVIITNNNPPV